MKIALYAGLCLLLTACGSGGGGEKNSNSTSSINQSTSSLLSTSAESSAAEMSSSSLMSASSQVSSSSSSSSTISSSRSSSVSSSRSSSSISSRSSSNSSTNNSSTSGAYERAITRGASFFGVTEQFNRYYTDPSWEPNDVVYVSPTGGGNGTSASTPTTPQNAINNAQPGDLIQFAAGTYNDACYEVQQSGTYNDPIVLKGARDAQGNLASKINCCNSGRKTCIHVESSNYVAIDSFEVAGGLRGVSAASGYPTSEHIKGNAILNSYGHDNSGDPFFTGSNDWFVIEGNKGERAGDDDGHGIYLSNGPDFNIVRYNDLNDNASSDFQINADPNETCGDVNSIQCDGDAKDGLGDGVSEYMLVENNYFHNGRGQGPNFTSVRNSIVRNNIVAFYEKHGMTFWQETDNPNLGSSNNIIHHNLLIGTNGRELFQFHHHSDHNDVRNNVIIGVNLSGNTAIINSNTVVRATSDTSANNTFVGNMYVGGRLTLMEDMDDYTAEYIGEVSPDDDEFDINTFNPAWFVDFPFDKLGSWDSFKPTSSAPWINQGLLDSESSQDFGGTERNATPELGPWESPAD